MKMNGMEHDMLMPGMLTAEQLAELDKARGPEWDRLFLKAIIAHHQGALKIDSVEGNGTTVAVSLRTAEPVA